jgi:type I restriction enzyme S subunit
MNTERGRVRNIHYGDILIKYGYIINDSSIVPFVNKDVDLTRYRKSSYLQNGDIIIADTAEDLTAGKAVEIQNVDCDILAGLHTMLCRPKNTFAPKFFGCYLNSPVYHNSIISLITGVKVSSISKHNISKTIIMTPNFAEQQKIADCLSSLDDIITAEDKKFEVLKVYKKGLMQKLFPAEGETVPEWRFPEFRDSDEWKTSTLDFLAVKLTEKNYDNRLNRVFTNSAVNGVIDQLDFFDKNIANRSNLVNYYILDKGDYVYNPRISMTAPVGPISRNNVGIGVISPLYIVFRFNHERNDYFEHLFKTTCWHQYLKNISNTGARHDRMSISSDGFMNMPLTYPVSEKEQQKIADCLSNLEHFITAQAEKIRILKTHKKGLMQGLFPSIEEVEE